MESRENDAMESVIKALEDGLNASENEDIEEAFINFLLDKEIGEAYSKLLKNDDEINEQSAPHSRSSNGKPQTSSSLKKLKIFQCEVCHKKFKQKGHLKSHSRTHTGEKPFECVVCKKKFSQKAHMLSHMRTHTGEKPFECGICKKKFAHLSTYKYHTKTHTGEKPYECEICKKKFSILSSLKCHEKIHTREK